MISKTSLELLQHYCFTNHSIFTDAWQLPTDRIWRFIEYLFELSNISTGVHRTPHQICKLVVRVRVVHVVVGRHEEKKCVSALYQQKISINVSTVLEYNAMYLCKEGGTNTPSPPSEGRMKPLFLFNHRTDLQRARGHRLPWHQRYRNPSCVQRGSHRPWSRAQWSLRHSSSHPSNGDEGALWSGAETRRDILQGVGVRDFLQRALVHCCAPAIPRQRYYTRPPNWSHHLWQARSLWLIIITQRLIVTL